MKGARGLRSRLILIYFTATVPPLALTLWTSVELLNRSLDISPISELDTTSKSLERVGREYYQLQRDNLKADARAGRAPAKIYAIKDRQVWPPALVDFWESGAPEAFETSGEGGARLELLERTAAGVRVYWRELGAPLRSLSDEYAKARAAIDSARDRNLRRGFFYTLLAVCSGIWIAGFAALAFFAHRVSSPIAKLTRGLGAVAAGDLAARVESDRNDEIGAAIAAFNDMADQLEKSREKLVQVTRLASWQALARKTAHEVKNSLTPIRLTVEEILARQTGEDAEFLRQAAQIVIDEVNSLERRVRAFSELASEPPVSLEPADLNAVVEERCSFLRSAHPDVVYNLELAPEQPAVMADPDLAKAVFTNLLENAAEAAGPGGVVLVRTAQRRGAAAVEIHDSGPGLSPQARATIFEPTISFKKGGMGIGLSIARKSALLCGGDVELIDSELGGAAFRVTLPLAPVERVTEMAAPGGAVKAR
jgi:two-component system nitrogen regulation sensor histidine kinase NtrY